MDTISILKDLAIILFAAKLGGVLARRLAAPQVVGEIVAGLLIGPSFLHIVGESDFITGVAEIGVILLMFCAGLDTNIKDMIKTGPKALALACGGVFVPLVGGWLIYGCFYGFGSVGSPEFLKAVFIGTIMTATSVGITVEALRELGVLKGYVGTTILNAAIIDDVIGIIVLTFVLSMNNPEENPMMVIVNTVLFFLFSGLIGYIFYRIFKFLDAQAPHHRRIPIFAMAFCFAMAYVAETVFGIADITGAYVAGIILCNIQDSPYISQKMDTSSYLFFGPVFFASIGLKTEFSSMDTSMIWFCLAFVAVALLTKLVGCGLVGKLCGFGGKDCFKIGVGMMTRGEVALIVAQKGLAAGIIGATFFTPVILLIIVSSIAVPIVLKLLYKGEDLGPKYYDVYKEQKEKMQGQM